MKIGILGAGKIGGTLGRHWANTGNQIFLSSRHPGDLQDLAKEIDHGAKVGTLEEAAVFGDVLVLAIPWRDKKDLPRSDLFEGKVVIDAMNPYTSYETVQELSPSTSSEEVAKLLPGARLVKAFNTMRVDDLRAGAVRKNRWAIFVAGDDPEAKRTVSRLTEEIGFVPIDTGSLHEGGKSQQPGSPVYAKRLTEEEALAIIRP